MRSSSLLLSVFCVLFALPAIPQESATVFSLPAELTTTTDLAALNAFANAQEQAGSYDLASEALQRAVALSPQDTAMRLRLAENLYKTGPGRSDSALTQASEVLTQTNDPTLRQRALLLRGMLNFETSNIYAAKKDFTEAIALDANNTRAAIGLASAELALGDPIAAAARLDALGDRINPYAVESRYLLRFAMNQFAATKPTLTAESRAALQSLAKRAGIFGAQ